MNPIKGRLILPGLYDTKPKPGEFVIRCPPLSKPPPRKGRRGPRKMTRGI